MVSTLVHSSYALEAEGTWIRRELTESTSFTTNHSLTEEEKEEQAALRKAYIEAVRASLRGTLNSVSIMEQDGSVTDLGKKYGNVGYTES